MKKTSNIPFDLNESSFSLPAKITIVFFFVASIVITILAGNMSFWNLLLVVPSFCLFGLLLGKLLFPRTRKARIISLEKSLFHSKKLFDDELFYYANKTLELLKEEERKENCKN